MRAVTLISSSSSSDNVYSEQRREYVVSVGNGRGGRERFDGRDAPTKPKRAEGKGRDDLRAHVVLDQLGRQR